MPELALIPTPANTGDERHRLLKDAAVKRFEEMVGGQRDGQILDDSVVDQDRAKERGLGLDITG